MTQDHAIEAENLRLLSKPRGSIEVICGSMFSGKTEELMRRLKRATIAKMRVEVFKPETDNRYSASDVVSHDRKAISCTPVAHSSNIVLMASDVDVVGIDEAQFFDSGIVDVCQALADDGIRVVISGLDMDFMRRPFAPMPALISIADSVTKVHAVCVSCGAPANYSFRLVEGDDQVLLGEIGEYAPLCRCCYLDRVKSSSQK
ncbi:thymidine kinase [Porphyromonas cangingivalis]|uniref:Thymidine kinase n=1 Tax=Porphyromonas cangingivalis TaxID=36874 RepID=A0A099WTB5_PORCN|nr:thymidine kinase [Porphyromonas cangingivalis]KGL49079.1 thymidine kinase [Porphyromonas cangingivalis]KGN82004.1 thymidine kinase [Porphyromonas cangingivalis]SJZ31802.1 thymidine kinase [Porphyromonas cangingivalis]SPY35899.1 Thymidine kinase [Porphyromonas cangingivalis]VEJ04513.1 Thymidine kinase [Porphyromonas cangingivalis]